MYQEFLSSLLSDTINRNLMMGKTLLMQRLFFLNKLTVLEIISYLYILLEFDNTSMILKEIGNTN